MSLAASSRLCCGSIDTTSLDAISPTVASSFPSATARMAMSRSVIMPVRRPFSTTGSAPTSSLFMSCAARLMLVPGSTVVGSAVMASRSALSCIRTPSALLVPRVYPLPRQSIGLRDVLRVALLLLGVRDRAALLDVVPVVLAGVSLVPALSILVAHEGGASRLDGTRTPGRGDGARRRARHRPQAGGAGRARALERHGPGSPRAAPRRPAHPDPDDARQGRPGRAPRAAPLGRAPARGGRAAALPRRQDRHRPADRERLLLRLRVPGADPRGGPRAHRGGDPARARRGPRLGAAR